MSGFIAAAQRRNELKAPPTADMRRLFRMFVARISQFKGNKPCQKRRRIKLANYAFHVAQTSR